MNFKPRPNVSFTAMFDANFLFASLIWGTVGMGYFIYGKKQREWAPMTGGLLMIVASYFFSALVMSIVCVGLMAGVYYLIREGY